MKNSGNAERKEEKERHASWLELFQDLVFVAVVSQLSENLSHDISWTGVLSFIALFIPVWFAWIGATFFASRFGTDDLAHRILTLLQMMGAAAMAVNVTHGLGETSAGFYWHEIYADLNTLIGNRTEIRELGLKSCFFRQ